MRQLFIIVQSVVIFAALGTTPAVAQYNGYPNQESVAGAPYAPNAASGNAGPIMNGRPVNAGMPASMTIPQWFAQYDQIRREAQMSPAERQQADTLMSQGLSILVPGERKIATKQLLGMMVGRYQRACAQLKSLPQIPPTQQLQYSYFNYFNTAGNLFADYIRVQDNLFLTDATTGQPLAAGLIQRKQMLEALEGQCKQMDAATRNQFGVPPYRY